MMPRIRTLKPEFFRSPDIAQLDFPVRIFYQALWCWADDFGVGETNLNGLLGFAFPDEDGFTAQDLRRFCADVARVLRVNFYTVRGRHYYAVPTWEDHQKLEKRGERRKYPPPDDPDATPDQRIYARADSAPDSPRKSGADSGGFGAGTGEQGNRGTGESLPAPTERENLLVPNAPRTRGEKAIAVLNSTAHSPEAHKIARAYAGASGEPIQGQVLGHLAVQIDAALNAGIDPRRIVQGLNDWRASSSWATSQIPTFIHKAAAKQNGVGKPTAKAISYQDAAEALLAEIGRA